MDGPSVRSITGRLQPHLEELRDRYGVDRIQLYGSVARGEAQAASDVDLLVEFSDVPSLFDIARLQEELESLLGCPVDITTPGGLHPRVLAAARNDAVELGAGA